MKILIVEDDKTLAQGLCSALQKEGFVVNNALTGADAKKLFVSFDPDIVILDLGLPDIDGIDVLKALRREQPTTPVLVLTARHSVEDKVQALDIGADDYLQKPFDMPELFARLRAMARRLGTASSSLIEIGAVTLNTAAHQLTVDSNDVALPRKEYMTLKVLMESAGRVKTKEALEGNLYDWSETIGSNTIEVHISNLRKKLPEGFIKTIRGVGYTIGQG